MYINIHNDLIMNQHPLTEAIIHISSTFRVQDAQICKMRHEWHIIFSIFIHLNTCFTPCLGLQEEEEEGT